MKKRILKIGLFIGLFSTLSWVVEAQNNLYVSYKSGATSTYSVANIKNIIHTSSQIIINNIDNTHIAIDLATIKKWNYKPTQLTANEEIEVENSFNIFPNPSKGIINISYQGKLLSNVNFSLFSLNGELIQTQELTQINSDSFNTLFETNARVNGVYVLRICTPNSVINKQVIINL